MEIATVEHGECSVVGLSGRLDHATSPELEQHCASLVEGGAHRVVFDVAGLEYVSSAGLRVILATAKRTRSLGGGVAVCSPSGVVAEAFAISGFASLMPVVDDLEAAIGAL